MIDINLNCIKNEQTCFRFDNFHSLMSCMFVHLVGACGMYLVVRRKGGSRGDAGSIYYLHDNLLVVVCRGLIFLFTP